MIHKIIGGKTKLNQRNIKNSISYLLREKKQKSKNLLKYYQAQKTIC